MSNSMIKTLPPLVLFPERPEKSDSWSERLETLVTSLPVAAWKKWRHRRTIHFIEDVTSREAGLEAMTDDELMQQIYQLRDALHVKGLLDDLISQSFAMIREVSRRQLGLRHYNVQLSGGYALLKGMVAEMDTGEGKTLTATLAAATAALAGIPVHVVTVNDYLAERDASVMKQLYGALGLSVGTIVHGLQPNERRAAYACDITYASNKEIAFDYLRDRLALGNRSRNLALKLSRLQQKQDHQGQVVMRGLHFAIVDEADSVLIDEARTPLIISRQTDVSTEQVWAEEAMELAQALEEETDFRLIKEEKRVQLTEKGRELLTEISETLGGVWLSRVRREEAARQALTALNLFHKDDHYLVRDGKVEIIDEYTGRIMADRSWSEGLHQLVEVKEGCEVTSRKVPIARMTYQRFFRRYQRLAGMSGTALEVSGELWQVYHLPVVRIPTNKPSQRSKQATQICLTAEEKWLTIVQRTRQLHQLGRPVLIGTRSVQTSEIVSEKLSEAGLEHVVLNANQDADEAQIIAQAGEAGRVTVATNMAGRGVDIRLEQGVEAIGGLHVILTERHDARRIDRQLEGRCARQGENGSTEEILSLEDGLLELLKFKGFQVLAAQDNPLGRKTADMIFRRAQRKAERSHAHARQELLKYDRKLGRMLAFSGGME